MIRKKVFDDLAAAIAYAKQQNETEGQYCYVIKSPGVNWDELFYAETFDANGLPCVQEGRDTVIFDPRD